MNSDLIEVESNLRTSPQETRYFRITLWILIILGVFYFCLFIYPNMQGAANKHDLMLVSADESITYPIVENMLQSSKDIHELWWRLIIYGDYHYGYPFYLASYLALLPIRLLRGQAFFNDVQLNLLILRQVINIIPLLLASGFIVYLQTRFRSIFKSVGLFIFILFIPGLFRQNIHWWHPDALTLLAIVLTIFFLDRDKLRLGKNFYLAAFFCGLASAIKLQGFFFFLTIIVYLAVPLFTKKAPLKRLLIAALGFVAVMLLTIVISNPFLFYPSQREKMLSIQTYKQTELSQGYTHDDPENYRKGYAFWAPTLERWYGNNIALIFVTLSLLAGCLWGRERWLNTLVLTWCAPLAVYLIFGVAPKPDHYWLPVMLPLFSGLTGFLYPLEIAIQTTQYPSRRVAFMVLLVGVYGLVLTMLFSNLEFISHIWKNAILVNSSLGY